MKLIHPKNIKIGDILNVDELWYPENYPESGSEESANSIVALKDNIMVIGKKYRGNDPLDRLTEKKCIIIQKYEIKPTQITKKPFLGIGKNILTPEALAEFDKVISEARVEFQKVNSKPWIKHRKVTEAWAKFEKTISEALDKYEKAKGKNV